MANLDFEAIKPIRSDWSTSGLNFLTDLFANPSEAGPNLQDTAARDSWTSPVLTPSILSSNLSVAPDLREHNGVDNGVGIIKFWDDNIAYFYNSRMSLWNTRHDREQEIRSCTRILSLAATVARRCRL